MHIEVRNLTKRNPGNNLPKWVKEEAESRGYGDSQGPLSLYITEEDIDAAFKELAQGNGSACVMAQAGQRLGARFVYFYRTTAWVDFGSGPIVRYSTSNDIYNHVIKPFDKNDKDNVRPGIYHLLPPRKSHSLKSRRENDAIKRNSTPGAKPGTTEPRPYMGRVVMASQEPSDNEAAAA